MYRTKLLVRAQKVGAVIQVLLAKLHVIILHAISAAGSEEWRTSTRGVQIMERTIAARRVAHIVHFYIAMRDVLRPSAGDRLWADVFVIRRWSIDKVLPIMSPAFWVSAKENRDRIGDAIAQTVHPFERVSAMKSLDRTIDANELALCSEELCRAAQVWLGSDSSNILLAQSGPEVASIVVAMASVSFLRDQHQTSHSLINISLFSCDAAIIGGATIEHSITTILHSLCEHWSLEHGYRDLVPSEAVFVLIAKLMLTLKNTGSIKVELWTTIISMIDSLIGQGIYVFGVHKKDIRVRRTIDDANRVLTMYKKFLNNTVDLEYMELLLYSIDSAAANMQG